MTIKELCTVLMKGQVKVISSRTGKLLLENAANCKNKKYGELIIHSLHPIIKTTKYTDWASPAILCYCDETEYRKVKEGTP